MASLFKGLLQRVIKVRIQGQINYKMTNRIAHEFKKAKIYQPTGVLVTVNSIGGSIPQSKAIVDIIKTYANKHNVPVYCFAQDQCLNSANIILTSGVKCYANQMSILGDFGYTWNSLWFKKFAQRFNVSVNYVTAGQNKVKFNVFQQIKPESQKWMKNYLFLLQHELKVNVINQRYAQFQKNKIQDPKILQQKLFTKGIIPIQNAVNLGLLDGVKNCDDIIKQKFAGQKILEINKKKADGWQSLLSSRGIQML